MLIYSPNESNEYSATQFLLKHSLNNPFIFTFSCLSNLSRAGASTRDALHPNIALNAIANDLRRAASWAGNVNVRQVNIRAHGVR